MTSPSVDDILKVLRKYERVLVAFLKQTDVVVKFPTELLRNCVISPSLKEKFDSLDNERLSPQLVVRYLLQQVGEQVKKDGSVFENFLQTLSGLDGRGKEVCEYLRGELDVSLSSQEATVGCDGEQKTSNNKEESVCLRQEDVRRLVEILAEVSDKWNEIGIMLGLPRHVRKDCNEGSNVVNLSNILCSSILSNQATLEKLQTALRSKVVDAGRAADALDKNFKTAIPYVSTRTLFSSLVTYQSCETEVADGKSTLLEVQVSSTESVSYQWMKDGQPLLDCEDYSSTCTDILFVSQASQGTGGNYACLVRTGDKKVCSDRINVFVKFSPIKAHILNLYSKYREVPVDSWPPVGSRAFIDLAMTKSSKLCTVSTSYALQGSVDSIIASKVSIKYKEALKFYKTGGLILVEGRPGSGKSTFIQKLVLDWTKGFILKGAKMVFLIPLRHGCLSGTEENLFHILNKIYYRGSQSLFMRDDIERMEVCDGEGICFVMDGLDEYHPQDESQSVIFKLLYKTYLPQAMVIVSSRPVATSILKQKAPITECFELIGFSKEDILKYIDSFPFSYCSEAASDKAGPENLKMYLHSHSNVFNMCYLPVNAAMICSLYDDRKGDIPTTETKMYEQFITLVIFRHYKLNKKPTSLASLDELSGKDQECFDHLCHLAFDMTVNSRHVLTWSQTSAGPRDASFLGLVTVDRVVQLTNPEAKQTCAFLHFTFQEFLAAYYISQFDCEGQIEIIKNNSLQFKPYLCNVWKFFCGLVKFAPRHFLKFLYYVMDGATIINFFLCPFQFAFESQQDAVYRSLIDVTRGIAFEAYLNPSDIAAVTRVISNCKNERFRILCLLEHCTDEDGVLKIFAFVENSKLLLLSNLILSNMSLGSASARAIATRLKYCENLEVLNLSRNNFCSRDIIGMIQDLKPYMRELDLSNNNIGDDIADYVHILGNRRTYSVNLSYCKISSKGIMTILCGLKKYVSKLYLQGNSSITCKDLIDLATSKDALGYDYDYLGDLHISLSDFGELANLKLIYPKIVFVQVELMRRRNSLSVAESHPLIKEFISSFKAKLDDLLFPFFPPTVISDSFLPDLNLTVYLC